MSATHIWLGPGTGDKGLVLRQGKPFDANEHDYLDIDAAVEAGKAKPLAPEEPVAERPYTPPPQQNFNEMPKGAGRKKGR